MAWLKVRAPNTAAMAAYTNAGFSPAGRLRQAGQWLGEPVDKVLTDCQPATFHTTWPTCALPWATNET
jgi:hypothetical protein